ncbi:hypothetical protein ASE16_04260 [Leifsonia sp. Root227]|uniref:hypothetical protein n=1 Tax=Leifsonia sp. Root227 TaxID=1736496 RepID=UPI0006FF09D4|nr:hypothetical protein [Leifsonia sp. Root227]KRC52255.1 hypothetical protein ASE16_04260 [Leifsonia sp. Root227]
MTDEQNWQAPGSQADAGAGHEQAPVPPAPRYGEYAPDNGQPQGYGQQQGQQQPGPGYPPPGFAYGRPGQGFPQQPGWTPPPKPGLIPLRPLGFGTLIGAPFQTLRRNPKITVGAALLLRGIPSIIASVLIFFGIYLLLDRAANATADDRSALLAGAAGGTIVLGLLSAVIDGISSALLQGVIVGEVARGTVGEKLTFRGIWQLVRGRVGALIGWTFLVALAWIVAAALVIVVAAVLFALGPAGVIGGVLVLIFGFLGLVVLAIWLNTKLVLVPSAIVLERLPIRRAMARSWGLTSGYFWKTFGTVALIAVIVYAVAQIISIPFGVVGGIVGGIFAPTSLSSPDSASFSQVLTSQIGVNLLASVVGAIVGAIMGVVQTSVVALIYIDLRMRKEGLDLQLVRFVEARQTGQDAQDPYLAGPVFVPPAASYPPAPGSYPPPGSWPPPPPGA